jgi:hypothetical protein
MSSRSFLIALVFIMTLTPFSIASAEAVHQAVELNYRLSASPFPIELVEFQGGRDGGRNVMSYGLVIAGLPVTFTAPQVSEMIGPCGGVMSAKIIRLRDTTGQPLAFSLIEMSSPSEVKKVITAFHGKTVHGHNLYVYAEGFGRDFREPICSEF